MLQYNHRRQLSTAKVLRINRETFPQMSGTISENMLKGSSLSSSRIIILCILICTVPATDVNPCYKYTPQSLHSLSGEIVYNNNDTGACTWFLPKPAFEEHALVLTLSNLRLSESHDGRDSCLANLYLPGQSGKCKFSTPLCAIYMTPRAADGCSRSYLEGISFTNQSCNEAFWHVEGGIDYRVDIVPQENVNKRFTLKYQFIDCSPSIPTSGKDTATQSSTPIINNVVTALSTTRNNYPNEGEDTISAQSSTPIIVIVVLGVILLTCIVANIALLHKLKQKSHGNLRPENPDAHAYAEIALASNNRVVAAPAGTPGIRAQDPGGYEAPILRREPKYDQWG